LSTKRTGAKALAMLAGSALALSACAASSTPSGNASASDTATTNPITFTWGYEQEFASYNPNTADGNSSANAVVLNQVLRGFWYFAPDGTVTPDTEFGTYEKTADDPLTVKYTFNDKAAWSDGNPLDCDDAVLTWLANSGTTGEKGFSSAATTGYEDMGKPACADGDKSFTVTYKTPFADWAALWGSGAIMPAHIVEAQSGVADVIAAADTPTSPDIQKMAAFYNTGWQFNPGELKPDISPSSGPYALDTWTATQSLTLKANPKWWGTPPKAETVALRYIGGDAMAQALQNGEINAMDPQPQVELVNQLKAAGEKVKYSTEDQFTWEHFDFNFRADFKDKNLRLAFAKCAPRQQIIDNLIKPVNPNAEILQSRFILPFQPAYADLAGTVGGDAYNTTDIPGAKKLLTDAGKTGLKVRIGWRKDPEAINKRRADTVALLKASCDQAGFDIVDDGTPDFFSKNLPDGNYDVAMFAWAGSPLVTGSNGIYTTNGDSNFGKYTNPEVDTVFKSLAQETNVDKQTALLKQADTLLWTDLATIPLFAFPGVVANGPNAEGVVYNATQADLSWNAYAWNLKSQ
jgi:peptide/nickel transport system substrate-binding protein